MKIQVSIPEFQIPTTYSQIETADGLVIECDSTEDGIEIYLPPLGTYSKITVIDVSGEAVNNPISIGLNGEDEELTIEGEQVILIESAFGSLTFESSVSAYIIAEVFTSETNKVYTTTTQLTAAAIKALATTPVSLLSALQELAGVYYSNIEVDLFMRYGTAAFACAGDIQLNFGGSAPLVLDPTLITSTAHRKLEIRGLGELSSSALSGITIDASSAVTLGDGEITAVVRCLRKPIPASFA